MYHTDQQLLEAFNEGGKSLPFSNLNPKQMPPQTFLIQSDPSPIVLKLAGIKSLGEQVKPLKSSDKAIQIILFGLSDKGNLAELKHGLSNDPIGVINTIVDLVVEQVKKQNLESIMFRFPTKKLKGREATVRKIIKNLAKRRLVQFDTLDEIDKFCQKHSYVVLYKKSKGLEAKGLPDIDSKRFKKDGDSYVDNETDKPVSPEVALATTISTASDKIEDRQIMPKIKISRQEIIRQLYSVYQAKEASDADDFSSEEYQAKYSKLSEYVPPVVNSKTKAIDVRIDFKSQMIAQATKDINTRSSDAYLKMDIRPIMQILLKLGQLNDGLTNITLSKEVNEYLANIKETNFQDALEAFIKFLLSKIKDPKAYGSLNHITYANLVSTCIMRLRQGTLEVSNEYTSDKFLNQIKSILSEDQLKSIKLYTGKQYDEINKFLNGISTELSETSEKVINDLDDGFTNGFKLLPGTIVYRAQKSRYSLMTKYLENKVLYFKNYLSTSLNPIIYAGEFGTVDSAGQFKNTLGPTDDIIEFMNDPDKNHFSTLGLIISGGDKFKVIAPGKMSGYPDECEVIFPRNMMLKINEVSKSFDSRKYIFKSEFVGLDQIDESSEIVDGDLFLEQGIIKPMNFKSLYTLNESIITTDPIKSALAEAIDLEKIPTKFKF